MKVARFDWRGSRTDSKGDVQDPFVGGQKPFGVDRSLLRRRLRFFGTRADDAKTGGLAIRKEGEASTAGDRYESPSGLAWMTR
jgi:hypothetical protein